MTTEDCEKANCPAVGQSQKCSKEKNCPLYKEKEKEKETKNG